MKTDKYKRISKILLTSFFVLVSFFVKAADTYAVIVAVEDYENYSRLDGDLDYTINDAIEMAKFLLSPAGGSVPRENIYLLTNEKAKKSNIIFYTIKLFSKAKANDKVIFYFAGHGDRGVFVPYDVTLTGRNMLYFSELKKLFKIARCKTKLLFADACYSGSLKKVATKSFKNKLNKGKKTRALKTQQIAVMLSSSRDEISLEMHNLKQGLFTYSIITGLKGIADKNKDSKITIEELFKYVYYTVVTTARKIQHKQTPVLFGNFDLGLVIGRVPIKK